MLTETHFKSKHSVGFVSIPDYTVCRRDRSGHRGAGVAVYVHSSLIPSTWMPTGDNNSFELLWVHVGNTLIGSFYHQPRALYVTNTLTSFIEACVIEISTVHPSAIIILAGDFNQLSDNDVVQNTGLIPIVTQPTRAASHLDRIYVSCPVYSTVRVVKSLVRSDHSAIVAHTEY